jgi:hypothetical protein
LAGEEGFGHRVIPRAGVQPERHSAGPLSEDDRKGAHKALELLTFRFTLSAGRACMRSLDRETGHAERDASNDCEHE